MKTIRIEVQAVAESNAVECAEIEAKIEEQTTAAISAARALLSHLQDAGLRIQAGSTLVYPRAGVHEAVRSVDLTKEEPAETPAAPPPLVEA